MREKEANNSDKKVKQRREDMLWRQLKHKIEERATKAVEKKAARNKKNIQEEH